MASTGGSHKQATLGHANFAGSGELSVHRTEDVPMLRGIGVSSGELSFTVINVDASTLTKWTEEHASGLAPLE